MNEKLADENFFPWTVRVFGFLGLLGVTVFASSLVIVHMAGPGIDWMNDYVSNMANEPLGEVFIVGAFVHGWGNLAMTLGLRGSLQPGKLRTWAVTLFGLAAIGILLAALFPVDPPDQIPTTTGQIHRAVASSTFFLELTALFVFSVAFSQSPDWYRQQTVSLVLSISAALSMAVFIVAIQIDLAPGLAERIALIILLIWEIWACFQLVRHR